MICTLLCFSFIAVTLINGQRSSGNSYRPNNHQLNSEDEDGRRVIYGQWAGPRQFPFMVSLKYAGEMTTSCGGTIIHKRWILTAAHCIHEGWGPLQVLAGTVYQNGPGASQGKLIDVETLIKHPNYIYIPGNETRNNITVIKNDIGLLKLHETLEWNSKIAPVKLEIVPREYRDDERGTIVGWGGIVPGKDKKDIQPQRLRWTWTRVMANFICQAYHYPYIQEDTHICASTLDTQRSVCSGDSGGPLIVNDYQVGVTSGGEDYCRLDIEPNLFAKVSHYYSWIDKTLRFYHDFIPPEGMM